MTDLDRDRLIALLKRLDGPDDQDVLAAGREIARCANDAGASWDDILAPGRPPEISAAAAPDGTADAAPPSDLAEKLSAEETAGARAEIDAVLAIKGISNATRSEIEDLRGDLAEGRFGRGDLRYVQALRARLS